MIQPVLRSETRTLAGDDMRLHWDPARMLGFIPVESWDIPWCQRYLNGGKPNGEPPLK